MVDEIMRLVDEFLADTRHQSLIDADRVRDFLLDLRSVAAFYNKHGRTDAGWEGPETEVNW